MNRSDQLRALKRQYSLRQADIADICAVSLHTVLAWLRAPQSPAHREPPEMALRLIRLAAPHYQKPPTPK